MTTLITCIAIAIIVCSMAVVLGVYISVNDFKRRGTR